MQRGNGTSQEAAPRRGKRRVTARGKPRRLRFGNFEFDPETLELHGNRESIRLQPQPAKLLHLLIASRGAVVSRAAVRRHLWPDEIHVEFDQSMNSCVKRIRVALGDSAEAPRYIETLPRIGYRFLQPVMEVRKGDPRLPAPRAAPTAPKPRPRSRRVAAAVLAAVPGVHADFVLDGRVQREQGTLRVWARLLLAKDGTVLWTEAYDGAEDEILVFQTEVSARIGDAVLGRLAQLVEEDPLTQLAPPGAGAAG